jgi:hypothetical protein
LAFDGLQELGGETVDAASSGGQLEELLDELNLTPNISSAHPPNRPLPHHVRRLNPESFAAPPGILGTPASCNTTLTGEVEKSPQVALKTDTKICGDFSPSP